MHVRVEEAVAQRLAQEALHHRHRDLPGIEPGFFQRGGMTDRRAVYPFRGEHAPGGAIPVHIRHAEIGIVLRVVGQFGRRRAFHAQIEFQRHRLRQRIDHGAETKAMRFVGEPLRHARREGEGGKIAGEFPLDAGTQHFHRDLARLFIRRQRFMHLRDGSSRDRLAERQEARRQRFAEFAFDDRLRGVGRKRRQTILQRLQRARHVRPDQIGPRRQHLPELHISGTETFQRLRQTHAGRRGRIVALARAEQAARDTKGQRHRRQIFARHQRVMLRQHARGVMQAANIGERAHQMRHAECSAAMPPERLRTFTRLSPAFSIIFANFACGGNLRMLSAR